MRNRGGTDQAVVVLLIVLLVALMLGGVPGVSTGNRIVDSGIYGLIGVTK